MTSVVHFRVITLNPKSYDEELITAHCTYLNNKATLKVHYQYMYYTQTSSTCAIYWLVKVCISFSILIICLLLSCRVNLFPCAVFQYFFHSVPVWFGHMATVLPATILHRQETHRVTEGMGSSLHQMQMQIHVHSLTEWLWMAELLSLSNPTFKL